MSSASIKPVVPKCKSLSSRKVALVVWGGWDGHQPKPCADAIAPWLSSKGFRVVMSDTLDIYMDSRKMRNVNLIVPIWTMGNITGDQWNGLCDAVVNGANMAGFHGGMCDAFRSNTGYQFMTGGQFVAHPGNISQYRVDITKPSDLIVKGLKAFNVKSEQYFMHVDPGNDVLAATTFSGKQGNCPWIKGTVMPVVWKRRFGKGRIFYSSLGHIADDFKVPEVFEILKRGMLWAAGERIKPEYISA